MSLADRLAAAKRERGVVPTQSTEDGGFSPAAPRARRNTDPFAELKRTVHQTLLDNLGPKLYDSRLTQSELEQKVRQTLQEVLAQEETPLTVADRAKIAQEIADDILGYGPLEPFRSTSSAPGRSTRSTAHSATKPTCAARSTRSWPGSAAASTSPARWSTRACPTAAA
jgi:hypothetical protein